MEGNNLIALVRDSKLERYILGCVLGGNSVTEIDVSSGDEALVILAKYNLVDWIVRILDASPRACVGKDYAMAMLCAKDYAHNEVLDVLIERMHGDTVVHSASIHMLDTIKVLGGHGIFIPSVWCTNTHCTNLADTGSISYGYYHHPGTTITGFHEWNPKTRRSSNRGYAKYLPEPIECGTTCLGCANASVKVMCHKDRAIDIPKDIALLIVSYV